MKVRWVFSSLLILIAFIITSCSNQDKEIANNISSINNVEDNPSSDSTNNNDNNKTEDSGKPIQEDNSYLKNDFTLEDIKKFILEADALTSKLFEGDIYSSSKIIGSEDGTDVYEYISYYNTFDKVKQLFGDYYSDKTLEKILIENGLINLFGIIGIIGADGEPRYWIETNSKIDMIIDEENRKIIEIEEISDVDDAEYIEYTLEKQTLGKWMIVDIGIYSSYDEIEKQLYYYDEFSLMTSSQLDNYPSINALDNTPETAWVEGAEDNGIGERLEFKSTDSYEVSGIKIINGYAKSEDLYYENNRVKKINIELPDNTVIEKDLEDGVLDYQTVEFGKVVDVSDIKIIIIEVYPGSKYNDTCISEIKVYR